MAFTLNPGQGSLFQNRDREKDSHPNMTGKLIVPDGVQPGDELRVAAWTKTSRNGDKFLSLNAEKAKPRESASGDAELSGGNAVSNADMDDEIPF